VGPVLSVLWILIPAPFVVYLVIDSVRKIFSEDETLLRTVFTTQPVTMLAGSTALGSVVVWSVSVAAVRLFSLLPL
jgi:hypothetical protein